MRTFRVLRGLAVGACVAIGLLAVPASGAMAAGIKICVPAKEGAAIVTAKAGTCEAGYTKTTMLPEAEQAKLEQVLPYVKFVKEGIDKKPTVQISGANFQIIDGSGTETTLNGTGNLILGYDETPGKQTGSHNLLLGGPSNSYTSYGSIVVGHANTSSNGYASILGGTENTASGYTSTIVGGRSNKTSANLATVSGGCSNLAGTGTLTISATCTETHAGFYASVLGGTGNRASAENATVSGGEFNLASDLLSSVDGGCDNVAGSSAALPASCSGTGAETILGGSTNIASGLQSTVAGGYSNVASGPAASVLAGEGNRAAGQESSVSGGCDNAAGEVDGSYGCTGADESVTGGRFNSATDRFSVVVGGCTNGAGSLGIGPQTCSQETGGETVVGGIYNRTWDGTTAYDYSTILGGDGNVSSSDCQTIPADGSENESCF
jgi:hypothetical protein